MSVKQMSFREWIDEVGEEHIAKLLKVKVWTVRHWKSGRVLPTDDKKLKILKYNRGAFTLHQMVEAHYSPQNKRRWNS